MIAGDLKGNVIEISVLIGHISAHAVQVCQLSIPLLMYTGVKFPPATQKIDTISQQIQKQIMKKQN